MFEDSNTNKGKKKGFKNFLKTQRMYIALSVCVLVLGTAIYFVVSSGGGEEVDVQSQQDTSLEEQMSESTASPKTSAQPSAEVSAQPEGSEDVEQADASADTEGSGSNSASGSTGAKTVLYLKMPVEGEITQEFSGDTMVYNKTLNMWSTHNGIDIAADAGDAVVAALAGTVSEVVMDNTMGWVVEIEHANNQVTRYAGLSEASVQEGSKVNAGQTIGTVGTPPFEAHMGVHLHFEYLVNGKYTDPVAKFSSSGS